MQQQSQDYVKCKYCKERIHISQMYAHNLECNLSNHPNYKSEIKSVVKYKQSHLQESRFPKQESNLQQSSSRQPVQIVESIIYPSEEDSRFKQQQSNNNQRSSNLTQNNNTQEIQQLNYQNSNLYTESLLKEAYKKCEYCDQEYPTQILEQHHPFCEAKILIEQLSLAEDQDESNNYQNYNLEDSPVNLDHLNQQQLDDIDDFHFNQPQNESSSYVTRIKEQLLPDGSIRKITTTKNLNTGQITNQSELISGIYSQQQQQQQQQQQPFQFSRSSEGSNQRSNLDLFFSSVFNTNSFSNSPRGRRNIFMPMTNSIFLHQPPWELENLAIIKYAPYDGLSQEYKQCTICLTNYEDGEELILLPCIHRFHKTCISQWFKEQSTCPICKTDVTQQEMGFEEDDQQ